MEEEREEEKVEEEVMGKREKLDTKKFSVNSCDLVVVLEFIHLTGFFFNFPFLLPPTPIMKSQRCHACVTGS